ncbi:MAG: hypothetical protein PHD51_00425 [Patescibacteria group bacterium]|nr:hypothetical protein [Patescibacteria group bacterium]MDD5490667.1 hypothetical protein [Patescibacteria group bacterium]
MQFLEGRNKRRNVILLTVLAILFIVVLIYVYIIFWSDSGISLTSGGVFSGKKSRVLETSFDKDLFDSAKFQSLKESVRLPVRSGAKGQPEPFRAVD